MSQTNNRTGYPATADAYRQAVAAREELAMALKSAGIQFPAMDVLMAGAAHSHRYGMIHLGQVSAPTARALAAALVRGAHR